jgi:2'-5' RNA ligase
LARLRTFIAVEVPDTLKDKIARIEEELKGAGAANWVNPWAVHLTLKFLGYVEEEKIKEIEREMDAAAMGVKPFKIRVEGLGGFPSPASPRVVWIGVPQSPELRRLNQRLEERMSLLGFEKEERPFSPHLTICRVKKPSEGTKIAGRLKGVAIEPEDFMADSMILFKSELKKDGAVHTPIRVIKFRG